MFVVFCKQEDGLAVVDVGFDQAMNIGIFSLLGRSASLCKRGNLGTQMVLENFVDPI